MSIEGKVAIVDFWGVRRKVALDIVDEDVTIGDHVLVHVGFAIRRISPEDLAETLAFFEAMTEDEMEGLAPRTPSSAEAT